MAKIKWEISREEYGVQYEIISNTRSDAIAQAESNYLAGTDYENELVGNVMEDGTVFHRSVVPVFTAKKIK